MGTVGALGVAETGPSQMARTEFAESGNSVVTQGKPGKMGRQDQHSTSPSAKPDTPLRPLQGLAGDTYRQVFTDSRDY
ncbi:hypothetical protein E2C01_036279 [Portunus trituberculatus]|uniref:Uncharacterized protein n=1 Tax=Portunus trituberculatus TaxID=210409 RepID=A0A5B7F6D1_PORTR|nr:hypothetical protein [Portunus trituberculatus]